MLCRVATGLLLASSALADELKPDKPKSFCDEAGWDMVFADDFNGSALDTKSWTVDLGAGDSRVRNSQGTADNVYLENGALVLRSKAEKAGKWNYTSGAVQTMGKVSWKHAGGTRACVRAKLPGGEGKAGPPPPHPAGWCDDTPCGSCRTGCPMGNTSTVCAGGKGCPGSSCNRCVCNKEGTSCDGGGSKRPDSQGVWPAHWMMPDNKACWPSNGEIDIMEMVNGDGVTHATYHWQPDGCGDKCTNGSSCPHPSVGASHPDQTDVSEWHEYAVEYGTDHIHYAFDGVVFQKVEAHQGPKGQTPDFYDVPYYMILNTAVGGPWPGDPTGTTKFPLYHYIDYVHVAQPSAVKVDSR